MQQVTPDIGEDFGPVEQGLMYAFILDLFQGLREGTPRRGFTHMPVKQTGLALLDPTKTSPENWMVSCVITGHLVTVLRGQEDFRMADHSTCLREGRAEVQKWVVLQVEKALTETLAGYPAQDERRRTEVGAQEWRDALFL